MTSRDDLILRAMRLVPHGWRDQVAIAMTDTKSWNRYLVVFELEGEWDYEWFGDPGEVLRFTGLAGGGDDCLCRFWDVWRLVEPGVSDTVLAEFPAVDWSTLP